VIAIAECFKTEEFTSEAQRVLYNSLNSIIMYQCSALLLSHKNLLSLKL